MWFLNAEYSFYSWSVITTLTSVILTCTSVIKTRMSVISTLTSVLLSRKSVILTRTSVILYILYAEGGFQTQIVISTLTSVIF
jgi:hypothetical protein